MNSVMFQVHSSSVILKCICGDAVVSRSKAAPRPQSAVRRSGSSALCMMCTTDPIAITFRPCGHQVACTQCSSRMKQCFSCHERIQEKVLIDISKSACIHRIHPLGERATGGCVRTEGSALPFATGQKRSLGRGGLKSGADIVTGG